MTMGEELKRFPLLKAIEVTELEALARVMKPQAFEAGALLFEKGADGDSMFLIRSGRVRIFIRSEQGEEMTFRHYGAGHIVGEFALLDGKPRSTSAAAAEPLETWVLSRDDFMRVLKERPIVGVEMMRGLAERIRYTTAYLQKLRDAVDLLIQGDYERAAIEMAITSDEEDIQSLIGVFLQMVQRFQASEAVTEGETTPQNDS